MKISKPPQNELNQLLSISNTTAQSFGQLPLYTTPQLTSSGARCEKRRLTQTSPSQNRSEKQFTSVAADMSSSFHLSIAWTLDAPSQALKDYVERSSHDDIHGMKINVSAVKAKLGNNVTSIPLASKIDSSNKFIEKYRGRG